MLHTLAHYMRRRLLTDRPHHDGQVHAAVGPRPAGGVPGALRLVHEDRFYTPIRRIQKSWRRRARPHVCKYANLTLPTPHQISVGGAAGSAVEITLPGSWCIHRPSQSPEALMAERRKS